MAEAEAIMQPLIDLVDEGKPKSSSGVSQKATPGEQPLVEIVMGSDSDLPKLEDGLKILKQFGIAYSARITSAHRTPTLMAEEASSAASKGFRCVIAAAGGAAHLPG
ncbi:hypothetical protein LTR53_019783, partial [Teratosphaeriaceae sp. CCFEE 6253]